MTGGAQLEESVVVNRYEVVTLCLAALGAAGAHRRVAELLTDAALFAEDRGAAVGGVAHLLDHLHAMDDGRLDGRAIPRLAHPTPAITTSDACGGIAQSGFDEAFPGLVRAARRLGLAAFAQQGSFTCGPLGWFTDRLADTGLVGLATAVAPAAPAAGPGTGRVVGTGPLAYSVPRAGRPPLTVDQVHDATTGGASPAMGYGGADIALLVELLSCMAGGNWSRDAPPWDSGSRSPSVGMFVLAIDPGAAGSGFPARAAGHLDRLADSGVGPAGGRVSADGGDHLELRADVLAALRSRGCG